MAPWLRLAALPSSLLVLITTSVSPVSSQTLNWPYNLPPDAKYYPEHEYLNKRNMDIQQKLLSKHPTGVRKMSGDPGEKFYLEYWGFGEEQEENDHTCWTNTSSYTSFDQPVRIHGYGETSRLFRRWPGWHPFDKRDFQCPAGTSACTSINRPNSCCATGSTCQLVQDTDNGLGDVGCCPNGETCGDSLSSCASGYISCPNSPGGGCCLPGYECFDVGCIQTSTSTVLPAPSPSTTTVTSYTTVTPSVSTPSTTSTSTPTTTTSTSSTTSSTSPLPPVILTVTRTVTVTASTSRSLTCSSGFRSCPASLGGGCCPTDRECGSASCPASTTSTTSSANAAPPVRPTSLTTTVETTTVSPPSSATTSSTTTALVSGCPTGFYACSAFYQGGCCQIGRDCASTSCPAVDSTTLVDGSTLTIVAPTGDGITAPGTLLTGACAQGWATCAASIGGGCCPSGYDCGVASCSATVSGGSNVGKMAPSSAATRNAVLTIDSWTVVVACLLASSMLAVLGA